MNELEKRIFEATMKAFEMSPGDVKRLDPNIEKLVRAYTAKFEQMSEQVIKRRRKLTYGMVIAKRYVCKEEFNQIEGIGTLREAIYCVQQSIKDQDSVPKSLIEEMMRNVQDFQSRLAKDRRDTEEYIKYLSTGRFAKLIPSVENVKAESVKTMHLVDALLEAAKITSYLLKASLEENYDKITEHIMNMDICANRIISHILNASINELSNEDQNKILLKENHWREDQHKCMNAKLSSVEHIPTRDLKQQHREVHA